MLFIKNIFVSLQSVILITNCSARETFFVNQLSAVADVILAPQGDFMVENYTFEVGGKRKTFDQIKDIPNSFVVTDDIEIGHKNKIPLWLFGLLY